MSKGRSSTLQTACKQELGEKDNSEGDCKGKDEAKDLQQGRVTHG